MPRFLSHAEVLTLHDLVLAQTGGLPGTRDTGVLESALAQPHMTFDGGELYPSLVEKAATLGFCLVKNHPFLDGNKRIGHAVMETFLILNGYEVAASVDVQEDLILRLAASRLERDEFLRWLQAHIQPFRL